MILKITLMLEELYMERDICTVIFRWPASEAPVGASDETGLETCIRIKCRYSTDVHVTHIDDICQRTFHILADISRSVSIHEVLCYLIYPMYSREYWENITVKTWSYVDSTLIIALE